MRRRPAPAGDPADLSAHLVLHRPSGFALDVRLEVPAGSTVALLGPNGAGKSTVVAALAGLLALDRGSIALGGRILDDPASGTFVPPEDRAIGLVFQDYVLFPHLDAVANVAFGLRCAGVGRRAATRAALGWLERMGLDGLADRRPSELSGGQAQRVALARALAAGPTALLLDEPLAALDVTTHAELRRTLADHLAVFDGPRLLITHDPTDAFLLADRVAILEGGRITQEGTPEEIRRHPRTAYAADLVGVNLLEGVAHHGLVTVTGGHGVHIADRAVAGPVLVAIHPRAVSLHPDEPHGSPRNTWAAPVLGLEAVDDRFRVALGGPLPLTAEVTDDGAAALGLSVGAMVWVAIKATEVSAQPAPAVRPGV